MESFSIKLGSMGALGMLLAWSPGAYDFPSGSYCLACVENFACSRIVSFELIAFL